MLPAAGGAAAAGAASPSSSASRTSAPSAHSRQPAGTSRGGSTTSVAGPTSSWIVMQWPYMREPSDRVRTKQAKWGGLRTRARRSADGRQKAATATFASSGRDGGYSNRILGT